MVLDLVRSYQKRNSVVGLKIGCAPPKFSITPICDEGQKRLPPF